MRKEDGYQQGKSLRIGARSHVHAAVRRSDDREVVLKSYPEDADGRQDSRARREFEALRRAAGEGVVSALDLLDDSTPPVLVLERVPGVSLREWVTAAQPPSAAAFLQVALQLSGALSRVHAARLIHRDVSPGNVVVDPVTLRTTLIDFGMARTLGTMLDGREEEVGTAALASTLLYVSPEQTGRMDRGIDPRSDLYSLGATLYFALTGQPPFPGDDALALIHAHMARRPTPPLDLRPSLAPSLSRIVMKLLQKSPEERYQMAGALQRDLLRCKEELERTGSIQDDFPLGTADAPYRPVFSRRLHGRAAEIRSLLASYAEAAAGRSAVLLLEGAPGIGKSALIQELRPTLVQGRGYLAQGKFDLYRRDQPYLGFAQALRGLVQQLLTESDARLQQWSELLGKALSNSAGALAELVPELRFVLRGIAPAQPLGPLETRLRLTLAVQRFIRVVATPEHPLVLFLDDMQWADATSRDLLSDLTQPTSELALLLICAYRDNEVDDRHPLRRLWEQLRERLVPLQVISLQPIDEQACAEMLADALGRSPEHTRSLAAIVARKTGNAPLLIQQFVYHLYDEGLLDFDPAIGWTWSEASLASANIPESAVGLLTAKISRLPHAVASVLELASCVSNAFDLEAITELSERPRAQLEAALLTLCDEGLISPAPQGFRFVHDRIREAAQTLLSASERARLHRQAGQCLLSRTPEYALDERVFEIADHLNAAAGAGMAGPEKLCSVQINVRACRRALAAGAGATALHYFSAAEQQFDAVLWESQPALCFDLFVLGADAAHQCREFERTNRCIERLIERPLSRVQEVQVLARQIRASTTTQPRQATTKLTLRLLRRFGMHWPHYPSSLRVWWEVLRTDWCLRAGLDDTALRPCAPENVERLMPLLIFHAGGQSFSMSSYRLVLIGTAHTLRLYRTAGFLTSPNLALAAFGVFRMPMGGNRERAMRYIEAARSWSAKHPNPAYDARCEMICVLYGDAWLRPRHSLVEPLRRVGEAASEAGDFEYACLSDASRITLMGFAGCPISEFIRESSHLGWTSFAYGLGPAYALGVRTFELLTGKRDLDEVLSELASSHEKELNFYLVVQLLMALVVLGDHERAYAEAERIAPDILCAQIGTHIVDFTFFRGVAAAAVARNASGQTRRTVLATLRQSLRALGRWATPGSDFVHMRDLVEAEHSMLTGKTRRALALYAKSAKDARAHGHRHHAALVHERRATVLRELQRTPEARADLRQAIALYKEWGAAAKVRALVVQLNGL